MPVIISSAKFSQISRDNSIPCLVQRRKYQHTPELTDHYQIPLRGRLLHQRWNQSLVRYSQLGECTRLEGTVSSYLCRPRYPSWPVPDCVRISACS